MRKALLLVALAGATAASAAHLTPAEALGRLAPAGRAASGAELVMEISAQPSAEPMVYLFSTRPGYLVVSADDRAPALLGYSDNGIADGQIAPAMQAWLEDYARQIAAAPAAGSRADEANGEVARASIAPMITTRWGQNAPYNDSCPVIETTQGLRRAVTGCVATAMAQVMYFHRTPATHGTGSIEYVTESERVPVSFDFENTVFDWDAMTASPKQDTEAASAVATLMAACGASVTMDYGVSASQSSSSDIPAALKKYFGYNRNVRSIERQGYSVADWEELVYTQLADSMPLIYSGTNALGEGHSFVCDGYSADGFYHFNWGWEGLSDGYYRLYALEPTSQGTGGSSVGFSWRQSIVVDVCPFSEDVETVYTFQIGNNLTVDNPTPAPGASIRFSGGVFNQTGEDVNNVTVYIAYTSRDGQETMFSTDVTGLPSLPTSYGYSAVQSVAPSGFAPGEYIVRQMVSVDGGAPFNVETNYRGSTNYMLLTVADDGSLTYAEPEITPMHIDDMRFTSPLNLDSYYRIEATAVNTGAETYFGTVVAAFFNEQGELCFSGNSLTLQLEPGESQPLSYVSPIVGLWNGAELIPGKYTVYFVDYTMLSLSDVIKRMSGILEVEAGNEATAPKAEITDFSVENADEGVDPSNVVINFTVKSSEGFFIGQKEFAVGYEEGGYLNYHIYSTPTLFIEEGESVETSVTINASSYLTGRTMGFANTLPWDYGTIRWFRISDDGALDAVLAPADGVSAVCDASGRVTVSASSAISSVEVWSIAGRRVAAVRGDATSAAVDLGAMPRGIYILKAVTAEGPASIRLLRP